MPAGTAHVADVAETKVVAVQRLPETAAVSERSVWPKFWPEIETIFVPLVGPLATLKSVIAGASCVNAASIFAPSEAVVSETEIPTPAALGVRQPTDESPSQMVCHMRQVIFSRDYSCRLSGSNGADARLKAWLFRTGSGQGVVVHMCARMSVHMSVRMCARMSVRMSAACVYTCLYACLYACLE